MRCIDCGIAELVGQNQLECHKFKKTFMKGEDLLVDCFYFSKKIFEDDELLSPLEHLLLKEQDISSKHLQGPV